MNHLQNNQVLSDSQHGFSAGFSCTTQLVSLIEDILYPVTGYGCPSTSRYDPSRFFKGFWHCASPSIIVEVEILSYWPIKLSAGLLNG